MRAIDLGVFERTIEATKAMLREGVKNISFWNPSTGLILADWQGNATAVALFSQLLSDLNKALEGPLGGQIGENGYLLLDLKNEEALVVIDHGDDLMQGWRIDSTKVQPGVLLGMAVPEAIASISAAK